MTFRPGLGLLPTFGWLWSWRDEFDSESYWSQEPGRAVLAGGGRLENRDERWYPPSAKAGTPAR